MSSFIDHIISRINPPDIRKVYRIHRELIHLLVRTAATAKDGHYDRDITARDGRAIPVRIYPPSVLSPKKRVLIFFHGGGWVIDDIDRYHKVCKQLSRITGSYVVSVNYRLAPENKYPAGLNDCYEAARQVYKYAVKRGVSKNDIVLIGDSAGGNLAAAVALKARDRGEFRIRRQILIYPAADCEFGEDSPYASFRKNGEGCILTAERMRGYFELYVNRPEEKNDPYVAPMKAKSLKGMPDTLVITAERCPLRDEGEAFAKRLYKSGARVMAFRIKKAYHGFFASDLQFNPHARKAVSMIMYFLRLTD
ncbi:MAG: alpha/beta hydrolase [Oscillospiraceae bacterium]|nr:alpha/beta hydrolase [Oscillospiraceae bacterium]MDY6209022.1 alpha/beta hydrolase [Oscillospiraceae bacterium]